MTGRGWLINRLSQRNANECKEPSKPLDNNITETLIPAINNGNHLQDNDMTKGSISVARNGIHLQENNTTLTPIPVVSNDIQPRVVRGRRVSIIIYLFFIRITFYSQYYLLFDKEKLFFYAFK